MWVTVITSLSQSKNWNEYVNHPNFPNSPMWYGYQEDMLTGGTDLTDGFGLRMEAYFIPPATGVYYFRIYCDDICMFNMGPAEGTKSTVIDYRTAGITTNFLSVS